MNSLCVVAHQPREPVPLRQSVDERPETHALHDAPHGDLPALSGWGSHEVIGFLARCVIGSRRRTPAPSLCIDLLKLVCSSCSLGGAYSGTSAPTFGSTSPLSSYTSGSPAIARPPRPPPPLPGRRTAISSY